MNEQILVAMNKVEPVDFYQEFRFFNICHIFDALEEVVKKAGRILKKSLQH